MRLFIITVLLFVFSKAEPTNLEQPVVLHPFLQTTYAPSITYTWQSQDYFLKECESQVDCNAYDGTSVDPRGGAWCDKKSGEDKGGCKICPVDCDDEGITWIQDREACWNNCNARRVVKSCQRETQHTDCGAAGGGFFCNMISDGKSGNCVACEFIDTVREEYSQCFSKLPFLRSITASSVCSTSCELTEISYLRSTANDTTDENLNFGYRFSDIESICPEPQDPDATRGCCANKDAVTICERSDPIPESHRLYGSYGFANHEVTNNTCGIRRCLDIGTGDNLQMRCVVIYNSDAIELDNIFGEYYDATEEIEHFIDVQANTDTLPCTREARNINNSPVLVAGECSEGVCVILHNTHTCPEPYTTTEFTVADCFQQNFGFTWDNLGGNNIQNSDETTDNCFQDENTGRCTAFGRQTKNVYCYSESWSNGNANNDAQEHVDSAFLVYYFDPYDNIPSKQNNITTMGHLDQEAKCIISQEEGKYQNPVKPCVIKKPGYYVYKDMDITWLNTLTGPTENPLTRTTILRIPIQTRSMVPVVSCPAGKICAGSIQCSYDLSDSYLFPCSGEFAGCIIATPSPTVDPTADPTQDPTVDPTQDPTFQNPTIDPTQDPTLDPTLDPTRDPVSVHGDPIVWTFNDECYDLNKDGLYLSTYHPIFDHWVNVAVYNDFMREIQVVSMNGKILLSINNLGMVDSENYPYYFKQTVNDCPQDMKKTECPGTYIEYEFDTQDFRYYAQLLRHDYLDPALKEGELGYHLDIKPRPFSSFEKRREEYKGLFFENPLPDELEYCEGGSPRYHK